MQLFFTVKLVCLFVYAAVFYSQVSVFFICFACLFCLFVCLLTCVFVALSLSAIKFFYYNSFVCLF